MLFHIDEALAQFLIFRTSLIIVFVSNASFIIMREREYCRNDSSDLIFIMMFTERFSLQVSIGLTQYQLLGKMSMPCVQTLIFN